MKTSIKPIILGSVLLTAFTACVNDDMTSSGSKVAVQISASTAATRTVDANWGQNDAIGITMLKAESTEVIAPYSNYSYTTPDGSSSFAPATSAQIMYFPVDGSEVSFKAYYPYSGTLSADMTAPLNVQDQRSLPVLDFMTAEHLAGTSKDEPDVRLHFHHRLAKVLLDLTTEDNSISLEGCKLVAKGLKTTGYYNIASEQLTVDANSTADIPVVIRNGKGEAIFLPRVAGEGVSFEVTTADGGVYTATLKSDVPFLAGHKHTLHIRLMKTPVSVSATIEEWQDGPESSSKAIRLVTGLEDSKNVTEGDTLALFLKDRTETYSYLTKWTYTANGTWVTDTPIYWESITSNPAHFIGTTVKDPKLNDTQMDDILISGETSVGQYTGINLKLEHAGSKVIVALKSTDNTFTTDELAGATITLPGYKYTGKVNEKGEFVIGDATGDIIAKDGVAIFPPQIIQQGGIIAIITINGRKYEAKATDAEGFDFKKNTANKLTVDMSKTEIKVSTEIIPWTEEEHEFKDVRIGSADLSANGGDLADGDKLYIYTGTDAGRTQQGGHFTYNSGTDSWNYSNSNSPLYWENMPADGNIYASITRPAIAADAAANNQLQDYITAEPVVNDGGVSNTALNFTMKHRVAKVIVALKSSTYTLDELKSATVVLPSYLTGATMEKGVFVPGTTIADIKLPNLVEDGTNGYVSDAAYLQPQNIDANTAVVKVTLNTAGANRDYEAKGKEVKYEAGKITTLIITLEKSGMQISTNVVDWTTENPIPLEGMFFTVGGGNAAGFEDGNQIGFYKTGGSTTTGISTTGTVATVNTSKVINLSPAWYRNDFTTGDKILAVSPQQTISSGASSFEFTCNGTSTKSTDLLTAVGTVGNNVNVSFDFVHALSKVTVNILAGDGFTDADLSGATVQLNNFKLTGDVSVADGTATATGTATAAFAPTKLGTPNGSAAASYEAIVMPQTITVASGGKTTIATVTFDGQTYSAEITASKTFVAGKNHVYNITLKKTGISLSTSVAGWGNGTGGDITIQ